MKSSSSYLKLLALTVVTLGLASAVRAAGPVTGFEAGDPAVTQKAGDASLQGTFQGVAAQQGTGQYLVTTISSDDGDGLFAVSGTDAIPNSNLQDFFSPALHNTSLPGTEGSGFMIPFTVVAGDQFLTLQYDFLTNELAPGNHNDVAFALTYDSTGALLGGVRTIQTANLAQGLLSQLSDQTRFQFHTGYTSFSISLAGFAPGTYSLGLGVEDRTSIDIPTALLVDNVQITGAVPEPSTFGLILAGAFGMAAIRRRIKR